MRVAIYCRVSTDEQAKADKTSLELQERECREHAARMRWQVVDVYLEDYTGTTLDRPQLNILLQNARAGKYDVMLCYKVNRMTRDAINGNLLLAQLRDHNVAIAFVLDNIDLNSDTGNIVLQIYFDMAERDRKNILRQLSDGRRGLTQRGVPLQMGPTLYGYQRVRTLTERKHVIDEKEAAVVRRVFAALDAGQSLHAVVKSLNADGYRTKNGKMWVAQSIKRMVAHPAYKGWTVADRWKWVRDGKVASRPKDEWIILDDTGATTPQIVTPELWDRVNARVTQNKGDQTRNRNRFYLLRGRIYCARCENRMYPISPKASYYVCATRKMQYVRKSEARDVPKTCDCPYIPADEMHAAVWEEFSTRLRNPDLLLGYAFQQMQRGPDPRLDADRQTYVTLRGQVRKRMRRVLDRIADEEDDDLYAQLKFDYQKLKGQEIEIESRLAEIDAIILEQEESLAHVRQLVDYLSVVDKSFWDKATDEARYEALEAFDVRIHASDPNVFSLSIWGMPLSGVLGESVTQPEPTSSRWLHNYHSPLVTFYITKV